MLSRSAEPPVSLCLPAAAAAPTQCVKAAEPAPQGCCVRRQHNHTTPPAAGTTAHERCFHVDAQPPRHTHLQQGGCRAADDVQQARRRGGGSARAAGARRRCQRVPQLGHACRACARRAAQPRHVGTSRCRGTAAVCGCVAPAGRQCGQWA
jgi:hypothetical protein